MHSDEQKCDANKIDHLKKEQSNKINWVTLIIQFFYFYLVQKFFFFFAFTSYNTICIFCPMRPHQQRDPSHCLAHSIYATTFLRIFSFSCEMLLAQPHTCCLFTSFIGAQIHLKLLFLQFQGSPGSTSLAFCFHKLSLLIQLKYPILQPLSIDSAP